MSDSTGEKTGDEKVEKTGDSAGEKTAMRSRKDQR